MKKDVLAAVGTAAAMLVWNNVIGPSLITSPPRRALANAAVGVAASVPFSARELGLTSFAKGARWGAVASAAPLGVYAVVGAVPALRNKFASEAPEDAPLQWLLLRIPFGTVVCEELLFRSVLHSLSRRAFGDRWSVAFDVAVFGAWHLRLADGSVGLVAFTGGSAAMFDFLRRGSGSVLAPAMFHYAVNAGGALLRVVNA